MYKIILVEKNHICFNISDDNVCYGYMLDPIIYDYTPGETMLLTGNMESWHKEDKQRFKHIQSLIGKDFDSYDKMIKNCNNWR